MAWIVRFRDDAGSMRDCSEIEKKISEMEVPVRKEDTQK